MAENFTEIVDWRNKTRIKQFIRIPQEKRFRIKSSKILYFKQFLNLQ